MAASLCGFGVAATRRRIATSTSSAGNSMCLPRSSASNMTRTAPASSLWSSTRTGGLPISSRHNGSPPADPVFSGEHVDVKPGNAIPAGNIPIGTIVHNIEIKIGKGGQIARSAGAYAQIVGRDGEYVILRLNSAEQRLVHGRCMATIGAVSNPDNMNISIGKAGRKRWMGRMPHNRGVSMNPIDHPHGGGEGRTSGGRHPVTPWGFPTKGKKTRRNKSTTKFIISSRHARKKK